MDINKASREELEKAFEVDGHRAEYIVNKRAELGGFKSWDQFKQVVPGFEDKMVENLEAAGLTLSSHADESRTSSSHDGEHKPSVQSSSHKQDRSGRDINEASREDLQRAFQLDGERAEYLVQKRRELGGFSRWEQIKELVPSFEDKMIAHLEEAGFTLEPRKNAA
jgi:DNA uptake protein ComE-like DNA-binding protein